MYMYNVARDFEHMELDHLPNYVPTGKYIVYTISEHIPGTILFSKRALHNSN